MQETTRQTQRWMTIVWAAAALQALITCAFSLTKLHSYNGSIIDLGYFQLFAQEMIHGQPLTGHLVPDYVISMHSLGNHFSPILFLLAPFYALWPYSETLLVAKSVLIALSAPLLFSTGRSLGVSPRIAGFFTCLALFNPFLFNASFCDFHEIAFAVPLMSLALWALVNRRVGLMALACVGLMLTKEHYGASVTGLGILWGVRHKDWRTGGFMIVGGAAWTWLVLEVIMPYFNPLGSHIMFQKVGGWNNRYAWIGLSRESVKEGLHIMLGTPISTPVYLMMLLGCVGYFPLLRPLFLLAGTADLLANILSSLEMQRLPTMYHSASLVPVFTVAAMQAWVTVPQLTPRIRKALLFIAFMTTLALFWPPRLAPMLPFVWHEPAEGHKHIEDFTGLLEGCKHPMLQSNIASNLPITSETRPFTPDFLKESDCIALRLHYPHAMAVVKKSMLYSPFMPLFPIDYAKAIQGVVESGEWDIVYWQSPWLFLKKHSEGNTPNPAIVQDITGQLKDMEWFFTYPLKLKKAAPH